VGPTGKAEVTKSHRTPVDGRLVRLFHNKDTKRVFVEVDDGSVLEYFAGTGFTPQPTP
jgi:hypothetical protein